MAKHGPAPKRLDAKKVEKIAGMGGTNDQIAAALGISASSLKNIRRRQRSVDRAIKRGKDSADLQVVGALYNKAVGVFIKDDKGEKINIPGDTTAMIFWLKNRRPKEWQDRHDVRGSVSMTARLSMAEMKKSLKRIDDGD